MEAKIHSGTTSSQNWNEQENRVHVHGIYHTANGELCNGSEISLLECLSVRQLINRAV